VLTICQHGVFSLDRWNDILQQVLFESFERWGMAEDISLSTIIRLCPPVGHDHDHWHALSVCQKVVEDVVDRRQALPFRLVAPNTMQQIENRVFPVGRIAGWCVDLHFAPGPDSPRVVLHHLEFATRDPVSLDIETLRRIGEYLFVVWSQFDSTLKTTTTTTRRIVDATRGC
jgi:hypothetical protein